MYARGGPLSATDPSGHCRGSINDCLPGDWGWDWSWGSWDCACAMVAEMIEFHRPRPWDQIVVNHEGLVRRYTEPAPIEEGRPETQLPQSTVDGPRFTDFLLNSTENVAATFGENSWSLAYGTSSAGADAAMSGVGDIAMHRGNPAHFFSSQIIETCVNTLQLVSRAAVQHHG
jgi:hypothetical protein